MRYVQSRSMVRRNRRSPRRGPLFVFLFLLFAGSFGGWVWYRGNSTQMTGTSAADAADTAADSVSSPMEGDKNEKTESTTPALDSVVAAVVPGSASAHEDVKEDAIDLAFLETGSGFSASAIRATEEGQYIVKVIAIPPAIDDLSMTYEAWVVKPGVTDYFSIGTLARREDGKWQVIWKQDEARVRPDMDQFTTVIVTREARDGNALPSPQHVFEGTFE